MSDPFATPWTVARQASLSITNSRSLLKLMSVESVMPSNQLILSRPLSSCLLSFLDFQHFPAVFRLNLNAAFKMITSGFPFNYISKDN